MNASDLQWIKPSWYSKGLRGTVGTVKSTRWCFQIFPNSSRSLPQNEFCHCIHFHCSGVWQIRKDFSSRVFFKFTKCMLHSNIIKTVKWSDKRQGFLYCLLQKLSEQRKAGSLLLVLQITVTCQYRYWIWSNILEVLQRGRPLHLLRILKTVQNCSSVFLYNDNGSKSHLALFIAFYFGVVNLEIYIWPDIMLSENYLISTWTYIEAKAVSTFINLGMNIAKMAQIERGEMGQQGREIKPSLIP